MLWSNRNVQSGYFLRFFYIQKIIMYKEKWNELIYILRNHYNFYFIFSNLCNQNVLAKTTKALSTKDLPYYLDFLILLAIVLTTLKKGTS